MDDVRKRMVERALKTLKKSSEYVGVGTLAELAEDSIRAIRDGDDALLAETVDQIASFIEGFETEPKRLGEILVDDNRVTEQDIAFALSRQKPIGQILVEEGKADEADVRWALNKQGLMEMGRSLKPAAAATEAEVRTMRVDERKIDVFSNMIGELVVARNAYEYLIGRLGDVPQIPPSVLKVFRDNLHLVSRVTNGMQEGVMSLRMIPIKGIFQKFNRIVRDISRKQGKLIEFATTGEETEIDKKIADVLSDPLIHLVRNACDHGAETPDKRKAVGKDEKATILLSASQEGSNLIIKISDDGKGINRNTLLEKALTMGLDVSSPDDEALLDVIFMPGFSTKTEVSDISGRGVGMDVVKTTVLSLGGKTNVISEVNKGTEITLTIPMTMAVATALLVESSGKDYAIPLEYVVETLAVPPGNIRRIHDRSGIWYRGEVLPLANLDQLLEGNTPGAQLRRNQRSVSRDSGENIPVVVLRNGKGKFGVAVHRLKKNIELSIKPVPEALSNIDIVSGVSILGDGKVVLVLNPQRLA